MKYEASLTQSGPCIFVKIYEDVIVHNIDLTPDGVAYTVTKKSWEPVCRGDAELVSLQDDEYGHIRSMVIRTNLYDFEIVPSQSPRYDAYKSQRHLS